MLRLPTAARFCLTIALSALTVLASLTVLAAPASAVRWEVPLWFKSRVCVDVDPAVDERWRLSRSMRLWRQDSPVSLYRPAPGRDCPMRSIHVVEVHRPNVTWTGMARYESGERNWHRKTSATVFLNTGVAVLDTYTEADRACYRGYVATHELGHALGLGHHFDVPQSVMSYASGWDCGVPDAFDRDILWRLYERHGLAVR